MNLLIDLLPTAVEVQGVKFEVNSDFRTFILFEMLMLDEEVSDEEKLANALELFYKTPPCDIEEAVESMMWFYRCGKSEDLIKQSEKGSGARINEAIYSYEHDDDYIYSAFLAQYRVDLQDVEYLHWWKFKAMFKTLTEDHEFVKIMSYRAMDLSKIKDKEQKEHYSKLKRMHKLPVSANQQQKTNAIAEILLNGGDFAKDIDTNQS